MKIILFSWVLSSLQIHIKQRGRQQWEKWPDFWETDQGIITRGAYTTSLSMRYVMARCDFLKHKCISNDLFQIISRGSGETYSGCIYKRFVMHLISTRNRYRGCAWFMLRTMQDTFDRPKGVHFPGSCCFHFSTCNYSQGLRQTFNYTFILNQSELQARQQVHGNELARSTFSTKQTILLVFYWIL